jgi:hypothetical protein
MEAGALMSRTTERYLVDSQRKITWRPFWKHLGFQLWLRDGLIGACLFGLGMAIYFSV